MEKRKVYALVAALLILASALAIQSRFTVQQPKPEYATMLAAAEQTQRCFDAIKAERLRRGYAIDPADDPAATGIIGLSYSEITTTLGALEAKRSVTNPNVAAMVVSFFSDLGLQPGDRVGVNFSGSFPGLDIAVHCAADAMGLELVGISSVGASTYGANLPELTWPDMEHYLWQSGLIQSTSVAVSMGGQDDLGLEFPLEVRERIALRLGENGAELLSFGDLAANLDHRMECYGSVDAFCNVGGNLLSFGAGGDMLAADSGIVTTLSDGGHGDGLVQRFLAQGTPVVHLLNMKDLLPANGLPYDPLPVPMVGEGAVYFETGHSAAAVVLSLCAVAAAGGVLAWAFQKQKKIEAA